MQSLSVNSESERPTIAILGSAGYIGKSLLRRMAYAHIDVRSLYHSRLPEPMAQVKPIFVDLLRYDQLLEALKGVNTVIHLAWNQSFRSLWDDAFWAHEGNRQDSRNIQMVKNLVQAMKELKTERIIFLSALGSSRTAETWYLQEKYFAEAIILNSDIPEKIILRTSLVYSNLKVGDRLVSAIERLMRFPWIYPVPKFPEKLAPIHMDDLCEIILRVIRLPKGMGAQVLEVSGGENLNIDEVFRFVSLGIGKGGHLPLKGLLGQALTPIFEQIHKRRQDAIPQIRDLLSVGNVRDQAIEINNPILSDLPPRTHKFQEAMISGE